MSVSCLSFGSGEKRLRCRSGACQECGDVFRTPARTLADLSSLLHLKFLSLGEWIELA